VEEEVTACFWLCIFCWEAKKKSSHLKLRRKAVNHIEKNLSDFEGALEYEKQSLEYIKKMKKSGTYGGHPEIKAMAFLLNRTIAIYESKYDESREVVGFDYKAHETVPNPTNNPILLCHFPEIHYQAIVPLNIDINLNQSSFERSKNLIKENSKLSTQTSIQFKPQVIAKKEEGQVYPKKTQDSDFYNDVFQYFIPGKKDIPSALIGKGEEFWRKRSKWKACVENNFSLIPILIELCKKKNLGIIVCHQIIYAKA